MDISQLSVAELVELNSKLPQVIEQRRNEKRKEAKKEVEAYAQKLGFTIADLFEKKAGTTVRVKGQRKPAAIKYRHPHNPELTWTARGMKPRWVMAWLAEGKTLEQCKV